MEAKEGPETAPNSQNASATTPPTQDSSPTQVGTESEDRVPPRESEPSSQSSALAPNEQSAPMEFTETEKPAPVAASSEEKSDEKIPDKTAHEATDKAQSEAKLPTTEPGNDQVTVEKTKQLLHESTGDAQPPLQATAPTTTTKAVSEPATKPLSVDTTTPSQPAMKPAPSLPVPATTPKPPPEFQQMITRGHGPSADETLERLRAPLTETYAPYIHAKDTSVADARQRLRTALEQTRHLREAFTDRVYKKYRVILRPVPESVESIVDPIVANPVSASRKLYEQMHEINEEKVIEKKETQKLATVKPPVGPDGALLPNVGTNAAETAEQIQFLSAGLSLVILPEDEVDESETDLSQFKYRGPINPETGQKVVGLSAAAASAAESLLDRVRRGGALRIERQRRRQLQLLTGEDTGTMYSSSLHLLSGDAARKTSPPYPSAGKSNRSRIRAALSGSNILSLSPSLEELKTDGKSSAATAALISSGVGLQRTIQQRWQHPYPESLGGRRALTSATGKKGLDANNPLVGQKLPEYVARSLPPLPILRAKRKPVKILDDPCSGTEGARTAVRTVLEQFVDTEKLLTTAKNASLDASSSDERMEISNKDATVANDEANESKTEIETATSSESDETRSVSSQQNCRKRGATEIGLMRSLRYAPEQEMKRPAEPAGSKTNGEQEGKSDACSAKTAEDQQATPSQSQEPASAKDTEPLIPPALAFSVMHTLGLVKESNHRTNNSSQNLLSLIDFTVFADKDSGAETNAEDKGTQAEPRMQVLSKKIWSRKRPFSYAFLSGITQDASESDPTEQAVDAEESATKKPRKEAQGEERESESEAQRTPSNGCPVLSIRGGGEEIVDGPDEPIRPQKEIAKRTRSASNENWTEKDAAQNPKSPESAASRPPSGSPMASPSSREASLHNQAMMAELKQHPLSLLNSRPPASASDALYSGYSPPRNSALPGRASSDRSGVLRHQHASLHGSPARTIQLAHGAYSMNRFPSPPARVSGDLSEYYGVPHETPRSSGYGPHADWSSLGSASSGYLPPPHSSLASMGLAGHRAAMVAELSVRDRAARALLAREQQQNAAVAAHAAAAHRHASIAGLSQTATLMGAPPVHGADYFGHPTGALGQFPQLGRAQSAPVGAVYPGGLDAPNGARTYKNKKSSKKANTSPSRQSSSRGDKDDDEGTEKKDGFGVNNRRAEGKCVKHREEPNEDASRDKIPKANGELPAAGPNSGKVGQGSVAGHSVAKKEARANLTAKKLRGNPSVKHDFLPPPTKLKTNNPTGIVSTEGSSSSSLATSGMQFVLPVAPSEMPAVVKDLILGGKFYSVLDENESSPIEGSALIEYLLAVGTAVPIPKAIILNPLKERLNTPGFKSQSNNATPPVPREVVVAGILVWLWAEHKESFQRAFAKSGRIDVDPECKWLIQSAVDAAVRALMIDIADAVARGGSMATALSGGRSKASASKLGGQASTKESDRHGGPSTSVDIHVARIVSHGLMSEFGMDDSMDAALPCYHDLVEYLDEARKYSLRTKSRERALLAALISRNATMSEQFSHAYTSAMVRAGEALGHEDLFEQVQDSDLAVSTMMPYDIYSDETGAWEDSCRPEGGFTANLPGEELIRRAHARAMIQKSLRKLQDRHSISGGTPVSGPYTDNPADASAVAARPPVQRTPSSSSLKRRSSFSIASESSFDQSSGTAVATTMEMYNPRHYSAPLFLDADDIENKPYGKHMKGYRERSFSFRSLSFSGSADDSESTRGRSKKRQKLARTNSISISPRRTDEEDGHSSLPRSTQEIDWVDVAEIFQPVALGPPTPTSRQGDEEGGASDKTIIAPYCRKVETPPGSSDEGDDEEGEEDITDEAVLARHRVVLDRMKEKIDKALEARQQQARPQGFQRGPRGRGRGR